MSSFKSIFSKGRQSVCFHSIFTPSYLLSLYEPYLGMVVEMAKKFSFRPWKSWIFKRNLMFDFWLHFCSSQCNESNWAVLSRFFQNVGQSVCFHSIFTLSYLLSLYEQYWRMVVEMAKKLCFRPWKSRIFKKNLMFDFWLHFCSSQCNESNWAVLSRFFQKKI